MNETRELKPELAYALEWMAAERDALRSFAQETLDAPTPRDLDAKVLAAAVRWGLLFEEPAQRACTDDCACAREYTPENFENGNAVCYVRSKLLTGAP